MLSLYEVHKLNT